MTVDKMTVRKMPVDKNDCQQYESGQNDCS